MSVILKRNSCHENKAVSAELTGNVNAWPWCCY